MAETTGWRWVPHAEYAWIPGRKKLEDPLTKIQTWTTQENEDIDYKGGEIDESKLEFVSETSLTKDLDNLVQLEEFGEGAIIHQLRKRYATDKIYTNIGTILVSVNPYKLLPIYTSSVVDKYREDYTSMAPHAFQIAADAYKRLLDEGMNQAVIISGESGAGKTEATKSVLQYLSDVAGSTSNVEQQILQSNPCLEAFGNAKTLRNDNSSRFGKWMEVIFAVGGRICAARIINYLLEKSRVVKQAEGERNYHIFYQLSTGLPKEAKEKLFIKEASEYLYLKQSGCYTINGVDDPYEFGRTVKALNQLNFSDEEIAQMWTVLSAVLNLGNLILASDKSKEGTTISNADQLDKVAKILKLNTATLQTALTFRSVTIRGSVSMIPLKLEEAIENRDALAKALYGKMFDWLIKKINVTLMKVKQAESEIMAIGILDIFGFEIFENNAFEQFCINYANEKLQQHFNEHIFKLEQDEYKREKIDVSFIDFVDNLECLKLIEANPFGILKMLDEEVSIPKGGDKSLITKMHKKFTEEQKHAFYGMIRKQPEVFIIKHYAGAVVYDSTGMVNKNRDKLLDSLTDLVQQSEVNLIREIFKPDEAAPPAETKETKEAKDAKKEEPAKGATGARRAQAKGAAPAAGKSGGGGGKPGASRTLASQFHAQLSSLMKTLTAANPHYIRCIKPNAAKQSGKFESKMVLRQMQYAGLFEAIRIRKAGFPFRIPHGEFVQRYRVCMKREQLKNLAEIKDEVKAAEYVLTCFSDQMDKKDYQMGVSKVFMRNSQRLILTRLRDNSLTLCVLKIQAFQRGNNARKFYLKLKAFAAKVKSIINERKIETLKAILVEAGENNMDLFLLVRVQEVYEYLEEEKRVAKLLEECCKENELEPINAGLEQVAKTKEKYPKEPLTDYYQKLITQSENQRDALIRKDKALKGLSVAVQNEDIKELQAAIQEGKDAELKPTDWDEAQKLLDRLEYEEKCIQDLVTALEGADPLIIEEKLILADRVPMDAKRREILANAKAALNKIYFTQLKTRMIAAKEAGKTHLPTHELTTPAAELPLPPEEKALVDGLLPKLESLKYTELVRMANEFLAEQVKQRVQAQKEAHYAYLQETLKAAEDDAKNHLPNHEVDIPANELSLPPLEQKIKATILPNLEKLEYKEFADEAKTVLEKLLTVRVQHLKQAHHDYLQTTLKLAEDDVKNHLPTHECATPASELPLPPEEKKLKEGIIPKLTKLGYNEFVETATPFLAARLAERESALKNAHHDYLQATIKTADAESAKYMPTFDNDKPVTELPPNEKVIHDHILPKLKSLNFQDFIQTCTSFLEAQQAKREAESARILAEKAEIERKKKEEEERIRREEERKRKEEEERIRLEEERKKEEERLAKERAALAEAERKRLEEEDRKRREEENRLLAERLEKERLAEEARLKAEQEAREKEAQRLKEEAEKKRLEAEAKLDAQRKQQELEYKKAKEKEEQEKALLEKKLEEQRKKQEEDYKKEREEQERKAKELAEQERLALERAAEAAKKRSGPRHSRSTVPTDGSVPPPPEDMELPPPPPEDLELPPPPPMDEEGAEKREAELLTAIKTRRLSVITKALQVAEEHGDKTKTVRVAHNLKDVLTEEKKCLTQLKDCITNLDVVPIKSLLREAANLGLDNPVISEARHLCYGMGKSELLTKRITLGLKNRDVAKLTALLEEVKQEGLENEEVEQARDFVAMSMDLGDLNKGQAIISLPGVEDSQAANYRAFLETKGQFPLRKFKLLRKEDNNAKKNYFRNKGAKKKRLAWQKEDIPRSMLKYSSAHCGGAKKAKLVKKIAKQIFKNVRGYMQDYYHAYPVTLAYEVVNTGVNEEILRDEIFAQLIKQTTKNPNTDSNLLGWKLIYLCVSTFWPSQEFKPILVSHLAENAPVKINKREFGFNHVEDLAYHCYIALDDKTPPVGEAPSMTDIEKITTGTLGSIPSFFSVDAGDEKGAHGAPAHVGPPLEPSVEFTPVAPPPPPPPSASEPAPPPPISDERTALM